MIRWHRLEKRSQAQRGRNLTRDLQASVAPMVHPASDGPCRQEPLFLPWDTGAIPQKILSSMSR